MRKIILTAFFATPVTILVTAVIASTLLITTVAFAESAQKDVQATTKNNADEMTLNLTPTTDSLSSPSTIIPAAPSVNAKSYVLMDEQTGTIIAQKNENMSLPPASLTKLMDLYIIFDAIKHGTINLDDKVLISTKAWHTGGSRMFVKAGDQVPANLLIQGITVQSGNDATIALAEHVAGSEKSFVDMMNQQAVRLGMTNTHFEDATGLPKDTHKTTAHDLAILTRAIIMDFPEQYHFFSEKWFTYAGIKQPNRNRLLWRFKGADGLKTGHTEAAGYCLITSAVRDNQRLIAIVLGAPTDNERSADSIQLLTYGFRFYRTEKLYDALTPVVTTRVWKGENKETPLGLAQPLYVTVPVGSKALLKTSIQPNKDITAPIKKGNNYGTVTVSLTNKILATAPLVALESNKEGGFFSGLSDDISKSVGHLFHKKDQSDNKSNESNQE